MTTNVDCDQQPQVEEGSANLLTRHYRLHLIPVLIRLVFDCLTTLLNIFARALHSVATGKCREQRRKNSFNHDESPVVEDGLRIGAQEADAVSSTAKFAYCADKPGYSVRHRTECD